jgi:acetyl-CoA synthetase
MPLSMLFGIDAMQYRLRDSGAICAIVDATALIGVLAARADCPALAHVITVGSAGGQGDVAWLEALRAQGERCDPVDTAADDPAILIYTSGTTGPPKGALVAHRGLIGNLSGFVCSQNWFPHMDAPGRSQPAMSPSGGGPLPSGGPGGRHSDAVFWSPADWAWTGGLMDALLPALYFGREIIGYQGRFDPVKAFELLQRYRVTHTFLFPTALKAMMKACRAERYTLRLRDHERGRVVGDAVFAYCRDALTSRSTMPVKPTQPSRRQPWPLARLPRAQAGPGARAGSMGRPYPGHRVAVIDDGVNVRAARPATWRCIGATSMATVIRFSFSATGTTTMPPAPSSPVTPTTAGAAPATPR